MKCHSAQLTSRGSTVLLPATNDSMALRTIF
nr:hypothetical protein EFPHDIBJ_EFPHDIBJ_CDS_0004 [Microvirus sp.]